MDSEEGKGFADSHPQFPIPLFCTLFNVLFFFFPLGLNTSHTSGGTSTTSSLSSSCKICISLVIGDFFFSFLPGTHFMQVTIPPSDTYKHKKKDQPHFFYLSFTSLALLEDARVEAVMAFIGAY